jgi:hypothetical protein
MRSSFYVMSSFEGVVLPPYHDVLRPSKPRTTRGERVPPDDEPAMVPVSFARVA